MMIFPPPLRILRRRPTRFALVAGLLTAAVGWWLLPPTPQFSIELPDEYCVVFSPKMRYLAFTAFDSSKNRATPEKIILWDIQAGCSLCSFPIFENNPWGEDLNYNQAFTQDETAFVEFSRGKAQFREVLTGNIRQPSRAVLFPHDKDEKEASSRLIADAHGRLFVLVKEKEKLWCVRDLSTGDETGSFSVPSDEKYHNPTRIALSPRFPGLMVFLNPKFMFEVREIPTGKILFQKVDLEGLFRNDWMITPDGKKRIEVDGQIHAYDNLGGHRKFNLPGEAWPVLSFDGRYLLVDIQPGTLPPYIGWIWDLIGNPCWGNAVLYDLENGTEIASFANVSVTSCWFSQDNRRVAIVSESVNIYDLPPRKPWHKIAAYALLVAGGVFLLGLIFSFFRRKKITPG